MFEISVSPIAFTIGEYSVRWYGIMTAVAVLFLIWWATHEMKHGAKITYDHIFNAALVGIPSGIIFARVLHVIDLWEYYSQNPSQIVGGLGLAIYGAVLGATLGLWIYSKLSKHSFAYFADVIAPGIIIAQAIGRVGCVVNGCCHGSETDAFCAVVYSNPDSFATLGIPVHPTQVYEIIYDLIVFGILFALRRKLKPDGSLFMIYLGLYSAWRIGLGFLREGTPFLFGLHQAQIIGIIILLIIIPIVTIRTRWAKPELETEAELEEEAADTDSEE